MPSILNGKQDEHFCPFHFYFYFIAMPCDVIRISHIWVFCEWCQEADDVYLIWRNKIRSNFVNTLELLALGLSFVCVLRVRVHHPNVYVSSAAPFMPSVCCAQWVLEHPTVLLRARMYRVCARISDGNVARVIIVHNNYRWTFTAKCNKAEIRFCTRAKADVLHAMLRSRHVAMAFSHSYIVWCSVNDREMERKAGNILKS